jgi:hypothetical protein
MSSPKSSLFLIFGDDIDNQCQHQKFKSWKNAFGFL